MSLRSDLSRLQRKLDDMPDRAVIVDQHGDAWQKSGYLGYWYRAFDGDGVDSFALVQRAHPAKVKQPEEIATRARRCSGCGEEHECPTEAMYAVTGPSRTNRSEDRCPLCGGLNGSHGLVHTRHGNGGGSNSPCPNRTDGSGR